MMPGADFELMSDEQLWVLHEEMARELKRRLLRQKAKLEDRLRKIERAGKQLGGARCPNPKLPPKYRNPKNPQETWAGRGKQPRWVKAELQTGRKLNDLLIASLEKQRRTG
jgi:DNA-binding protein H-NS